MSETAGRRTVDWIIATRPWAFSASVVPVLAAAAFLGCRGGRFDAVNVVLSLAVIVFLHAGADVLSDCRDHGRGVDRPGSSNGVTWIHDGTFTVRELVRFAVSLLAVGSVIGCIVVLRSTLDALWIGFAGAAIAAGYSFLKYRALGDVAVFLAFTALPAAGLGPVSVGAFVPELLLVALPPGLLTCAVLNANNIRDAAADAAAGCRTLPMVIGRKTAVRLYFVQTFLPYLLVGASVFAGLMPYASVAVFLTARLAFDNAVRAAENGFDGLDRSSAKLQLLFGILLIVSFPVGLLDFWWQISLASLLTGFLSLRNMQRDICRRISVELPLGISMAAVLWGVFFIGDSLARALFGFAGAEIDAVYALREGTSPLVIASLLLLLIGPAEELFWRGLVQRRLAERFGANAGFALAALAYTLVHVWSMNFMLIAAAAVCGLFWGAFYRFFPRHLPALAVSHALWDVAVFVLFPI